MSIFLSYFIFLFWIIIIGIYIIAFERDNTLALVAYASLIFGFNGIFPLILALLRLSKTKEFN
jgi:hypothetical protein